MTIIIDFDALKVAELYLHTLLSRATGHITGQHEVNLNATTLMPQYKSRLEKWATLHTPTPVVAPTPAEPQVSVSMKQMEADNNADLQRRVNKARAIQRLEEYAKNVGLADTQANADLIRKWVEASGGVWTVQIVDAAVQELNNQLEWRSTEPAPEPEKPEVLQPWQLPLDTPDWKLKQFNAEQLKDLVARRRAATTGKYIRPRGTWGSSLF